MIFFSSIWELKCRPSIAQHNPWLRRWTKCPSQSWSDAVYAYLSLALCPVLLAKNPHVILQRNDVD